MDHARRSSEQPATQPLPIPIQIFFWQQTSPFTRPKLGKLHEASCMELKEACKSFEKVLVQNLQFGLSPSLTDAIQSIPRWRLVQAAFPHVLHCTSSLLFNRKDTNLQNLGNAESKMLYILHWIILDAADECADADYEKGIIPTSPFYYIFPVSSITLFIYLLAPLCHQVKEADLQTFRLENGVKLWHAMWEYRHPDARCFTALCKPRPAALWRQAKQKRATHFGDVFIGRKATPCESHSVTGSPPSQVNLGLSSDPSSKITEDDMWVSSPKDTAFPETIPEESSSTEDEHVATDATLFHAQKRASKTHSELASDSFIKINMQGRRQSSVDKESVMSVRTDKFGVESNSAATVLDVSVLRCLFIPQWPEEGVYWALQFLYHRLRDVPDTNKEEPEQRKRSNSLPNPQLKINFCTDTDSFKKDKKEYIEVPEVKDVSPIAGMPPPHKDGGHFRRASEKVKKKMKMADLRAFVETKLLSKSEKHLEKYSQDKKMFKDEHHGSLDHGDEEVTNNFCGYLEPDNRQGTNLIKGKSMPSLRYIGETRMEWVELSPNPIITVTEHSPAPSPDVTRTKSRVTVGSSGSQHESVIASLRAGRHRGRLLTRSVSDTKINYSADDSLELAGSAHYITPDGDIDLVVVAKGIQSIAQRDNLTCSLRVCEGILNVVEVVLGMGVLKQDYDKHGQAQPSILTSLVRVVKHLGCPQGCADAFRGPPAEFLRSLAQSLLSKIYRSSPKGFAKYFRNFIQTQSITDIMDFFHAYVGFCVDPSTLLSPLNQRRGCNKSPDAGSHGGGGGGSGGGGVGTGFNVMGSSHVSPLETHIVAAVLKPLVSKLVRTSKELKLSENMTVYGDVRQLMNYIKEVHGNSLRRVAMSGLIDTAVRPHRKPSDLQTTRVIRHIPQSDQDDSFEHGTCYVVEEKDSKKLLFKKRSTSSTCASIVEGEVSEDIQSPISNVRKKQHVLTPRHSQRTLIAHPHELHKQPSRFHIGGLVNWLRKEYKRGESLDSQGSAESPGDAPYPTHPHAFHHSYSKGSQKSTTSVTLTLQRARRRMEDQFTKFGFGRGKKKDGSLEETQGSLMSRRNSMEVAEGKGRDCEVVVLKARRLVKKDALYQGMSRLALLLDTCHPATLPHPHLLAASLDLPQAPVVSRAAFLLECAYFVHCCNKGQWPAWLKHNFPLFRPSGPPASGRPGSTSARRSHVLQRHAGNMFYQWAEAIGARLEEMMNEDKSQVPNIINMISDENKQKDLLIEDEEEDFLDEDQVSGSCPVALRLVACVLLMEITAFLRETYQTLPKSCGQTRQDKPQPWVYNKDTNRRWSMALSSMGHSQASAQSLQSINDNKDPGKDGERKISFVLHEPDNESEGSSNTTVTVQGEEVIDPKNRRQRPLLLRRGTATATTGSFKRRSLKLRRGKDQMTLPCDPNLRNKDNSAVPNLDNDFRRSDSLQNKRKVSSLSDRSDTSEQGVLGGEVSGGEESPGVLSDEQPPESPTDTNDTDETANMPWLKVMVQTINSFNYYCSHQNFCHPFCHKRHMRAVTRLIKSIRQVYGEEFGVMADTLKVSSDHKKDQHHKYSGRKVSEQTSPIKMKDSTHSKKDKDKLDRSTDNSSGHTSNKDVIISDDREPIREPIKEKPKESPPILKYIKAQVGECFHCCVDGLLKGGVVITSELLAEVLAPAWQLLLEPSQQTAASAAALVILASVKAPAQAAQLTHSALSHPDPSVRISAILRFQVLWKMRYQVWCRMEEGAQVTFKVPPPGIEFTLPSPKIGIESLPVVDPPWMPQVKTKVEEVQAMSQESHRSLVTATKTRKKQQTELIKTVLQEKEDKKRLERENFLVTSIPITIQAAHEPSLHHAVGDDHDEVGGGEEEVPEGQTRNPSHHIHSAQSLFPSCLCSAVIQIINLLDDAAVSPDGNAVYEVAYQVIWNCLVEDSALFLRYILERLTRDNQDLMFKVLRHLIRFVPRLPQQAAFTLYNYIIGYVMFYVRTPHEDGQTLIGAALSILWMVVHSVHGIMFKDLKQILRKEQCDASILLTANVPSTKKIIIEGPPGLCYSSQFPVQEDTQFGQILRESLNYFIDKGIYLKDCFLVDHKTRQIHNPSSYVRDYYFFKRSHYPQLDLVPMHPDEAYYALQNRALKVKTVEVGKVLLTWAILKNVDMVVQRVVFLHEELMKLPSFPRKALEADLDIFRGGKLGQEILGMDVLHKFMWVRLIARMFEAMAGNFAYSGDIHLFLNVLNGAVMLHSQDATLLRYVMATYINAAYNFKNIFSLNGYLVIIPSLLQLYASHQTNKLVTRTVEYVIKQFYLMNRKPFILQMFGAVSSILDIDTTSQFGDAHKVPANCLFRILLSLETPSPDPLNIGELVKEEQPLRAIDFCYREESEMVTVLDCISLCVMVVAYAAESVRAYQMLTILEAIMPCYLQHIQLSVHRREGKTEREIIAHLSIAINTLISNCEALTKNYSGPQKTSPDHKGSSQRNYSQYATGFEFDDESHTKFINERTKTTRDNYADSEDPEAEFRRPRDVLLSLVAEFNTKTTARLIELNKKFPQDGKPIELIDLRSQMRLADIAHSLLKASPYVPETMACKGLLLYMHQLMPATDWNNEAMRPTLTMFLRRIDKTFSKIYKKPSIRRSVDWEAASGLLRGVFETLARYPYIVHMQHFKTLVGTIQALLVGESSTGLGENLSSATVALMSQEPPAQFSVVVVKLIALQILAMGDSYTLEHVCGGGTMFPTYEKTENILMNLLMPLCLRVGCGRKDVHLVREVDINFTLTVILNAMCPPSLRSPITMQNFKAPADFRTGSFSFNKTASSIPKSLYQISFLALKMVVVCFENELECEWPRIARIVQELSKVSDARQYFWSFIDFVVEQRPPLFPILQPFIRLKLNMTPLSEAERHIHYVVRERLSGYCLNGPKCRGIVLSDMATELRHLKEDLANKKNNEVVNRGKEGGVGGSFGAEPPSAAMLQSRHRPSIIDLFTGSQAPTGTHTPIHRESVSSISGGTSQDQHGINIPRNVSSTDMVSPDDATDSKSKPRLQRSKAQSRKTFRLRKNRMESSLSSLTQREEREGSPPGRLVRTEVSMEEDSFTSAGSLGSSLLDHGSVQHHGSIQHHHPSAREVARSLSLDQKTTCTELPFPGHLVASLMEPKGQPLGSFAEHQATDCVVDRQGQVSLSGTLSDPVSLSQLAQSKAKPAAVLHMSSEGIVGSSDSETRQSQHSLVMVFDEDTLI